MKKFDFDGFDEILEEGICEIVKYHRELLDDESLTTDLGKAIFKVLYGSSCGGDEDTLTDDFEDVCRHTFEALGYDFDAAEEILDRLYEIDGEEDEEDVIAVLCDFDEVSRCLAEKSVYPGVLIESLSILTNWIDCGFLPSLSLELKYIVSIYTNVSAARGYRKELEEIDYKGCEDTGLPSTIEREIYTSSDMAELHDLFKILRGDSENEE